MMKKISIILTLLLCVFLSSNAMALDVTPQDPDITFIWDDSDLERVLGFKLYWSDTEVGGYVNVVGVDGRPLVFTYDSAGPACTPTDPCTAEQGFVIASTPRRYKKYFRLTAFTADMESDMSDPAVDKDGIKEVWFINPLGRPFGVKVMLIRQ